MPSADPSSEISVPAPLPADEGEQFRLLLNAVEDYALILHDLEGHIASWNAGAERLTGFTEAEAVGQKSSLIFTPEDRAAGAPEEELRAAREAGRAEDVRWHQRKDGSRFWGEGVMTLLRDSGPRGFCKILRDLTQKKRNEDELRETLERERNIARVLQRPLTLALAPDSFPGVTLATRYEPASAEADVGGDFFDAFALPRGRVALAVADASGKGLAAAARAIQVKEVLRAFTREYPHSPAHIASRINDYVCSHRELELDSGPSERFVTLALVILDPITGEMSVVSAAAEPPLVLRASGTVEVIEAPPGLAGLPLGVQPGELYHALPLRLGHGDTLVLTTDGITDARRDRTLFLGQEGLQEVVRTALPTARTLTEAAERVVESAREFSLGRFRDDVCLLLARRK